ncbi:MAG: hypothetical protein GY870_16670, partial [archaeon]|nr:hypothetical protein [archaeon]
NNRGNSRNNRDNSRNNDSQIIVRNRDDKDRFIKDAIFSFSGGKKSLLIKGEGNEISTAVEIAEIIKNRMYPSIEVANISLGSRPFFNKRNNNRGRGNYQGNNNKDQKNKNEIVSRIEILLKTT